MGRCRVCCGVSGLVVEIRWGWGFAGLRPDRFVCCLVGWRGCRRCRYCRAGVGEFVCRCHHFFPVYCKRGQRCRVSRALPLQLSSPLLRVIHLEVCECCCLPLLVCQGGRAACRLAFAFSLLLPSPWFDTYFRFRLGFLWLGSCWHGASYSPIFTCSRPSWHFSPGGQLGLFLSVWWCFC